MILQGLSLQTKKILYNIFLIRWRDLVTDIFLQKIHRPRLNLVTIRHPGSRLSNCRRGSFHPQGGSNPDQLGQIK